MFTCNTNCNRSIICKIAGCCSKSLIHIGKYKCIFCSNAYDYKCRLKYHFPCHIIILKHTCTICKKMFCDTPSVKNHILKTHWKDFYNF
jgi:hypothetical protein